MENENTIEAEQEFNTTSINSTINALERSQWIAKLDREWEIEMNRYYVKTSTGLKKPSKLIGATRIVAAIGMGVLWIFATSHLTGYPVSLILQVIGTLFVLVTAWQGIQMILKSIRMQNAYRNYLSRREQLINSAL